jgi:hypothetical protein
MRRVVSSAVIALGLVGAGLAVGAVPAMAAGKKVCTIQDERLGELSGLVASGSGYITINDSTERSSEERIFYLSGKCGVGKNVQYSGDGPRDTEDLALSPDGKTLWIADIGDNPDSNPRRTSVALWTMPVDGSKRPTIHRLAYPERKPHDAEALLVGGDNIPIIITKTGGKAELFSPTAALKANGATPVAMAKVGEVTLPKTATDNPFGAIGRLMVTGAARAPDGSRVVLRTYADAFEYDVAGGDVVKALTTGQPRVTPLDSDKFGESIAYSADGRSFLTVSDLGTLEDTSNDLLRYTPAQAAPKATVAASAGGGKSGDGRSWVDDLTLQDITYLIGAVGVVGALLVGAGIFGILRARRRPPADPAGAKVGAGGDDGGDGPTVGRQPVPGAAGVAAVASVAPVDERQAGFDDSGWDRRPGGYDDGYRPDYSPANDYQPAGQTYGAPARPPGASGGSGAVYGSRPGGSGGGGRGGPVGAGGGRGGVYGGGAAGAEGGVYGAGPGGGEGGVYGGGQYRSGAPNGTPNGATPGVYGQPQQPPGYPDGTW